jgi:uncharacterized membrane protein
LEFPGPGTAMAFAAAVAAGAAGYSSNYSNNQYIAGGLIGLSVLLALFTLIIERWSGPYHKNKHEIAAQELDLIGKLKQMSDGGTIKDEEYQKINDYAAK